ncbi:PAS domain-containing sensor histidine kinase [Corallococcus carmarthensis]|uniref:histidine kinase n=1 Tax=Corallococcus carmarthensis TaxID=2316728 RepID=A0A3A8KYZ3_9BACT|nr:ATP-binding protein [Corallococcus carmarthensis]RKH07214.1 PAS domain S-box protein [Corallococcus carmarthensis]
MKGDRSAEPAAWEGPAHSRATPTSRASPVELLLQVGASLHATLVVDRQGRIVWMDPVLAGAAGWRSGPPVGHSAQEVLGGLPWLLHAFDAALAGTDGLCEDGGEGQRLSAVVVPVFDEDGTQVGACARLRKSERPRPEAAGAPQALCLGAVEERRAREHLEHQTSLLRATFDSITDGVIVVDLARRITAFNKRFQEIWGLTDAMMEERDAEKALASVEPRVTAPGRFIAFIREGFEPTFEYRSSIVELRDGRVLECKSIPQLLGEAIIGRIWSYRDVTAERQALAEQARLLVAEQEARERLEESFAVLDTFLNHAPVALGFIGRDLRYLRSNDALAALHGRRREEELGKTVREMTPQMAPFVEPLMRQVLDEGTPIIGLNMTGEVPSTPGEQRHWNVSYYPVRTASGTILGVGVVVAEITAEYRAQAERDRLLREAQEAIRIRDDFMSIAAHELKTPLTPLKLHLQMLKGQADTGHGVASRHVDKALAQLARLSLLVNDLLDTSRIQAGKLELATEPIPLREFIREVLLDFRGTSSLHSLRFEAPDEPLVILGDRARLAQVLTNLVENAFKYSPTGGTIRVTARRMGTEACVSVKDEGIGIPKEEQAHLFERFFRARNAPISGFGGLGLGLYICRDIIERHGGRIWVESEVEHGSTFHFVLPCL